MTLDAKKIAEMLGKDRGLTRIHYNRQVCEFQCHAAGLHRTEMNRASLVQAGCHKALSRGEPGCLGRGARLDFRKLFVQGNQS